MRAQFLLCVIVLLILKQVASSDVIVKQKPVLRGQDVHLRIPTPDLIQGSKRLQWRYNMDTLLEYNFDIPYLDRRFAKYNESLFTFSEADYSLSLKKLTKMDSGHYEALEFKEVYTSIVKYNVTVQDGVSPVNLTVVSIFPGFDSCNVTVTCSSENSSVNNTFTCNNQHCSPEGGQSSQVWTSTGLLSVYMSEGFINCSHSNEVSSLKEGTTLCQFVSGSKGESSRAYIGGILVGCICGVVVIGIIIYLIRRHKTGNATIDNDVPNTTYVSVQSPTTVPAMPNPDSANGQRPEHRDTPVTIYSLLQHPSGSVAVATTETTSNTTNPDSLYAQVQRKPARR